jgi:hypothetical protein
MLTQPGEKRVRFLNGKIVVPQMRPHPSDHCPLVADLVIEKK